MARVAVANRVASTRGNIIYNGGFEIKPTFVAATAAGNRWIDGTSGGSQAQRSGWGWGIINASTAGTFSSQFDTTTFQSGAAALRVSTLATNSNLSIGNARGTTAADMNRGLIPILPSTTYIYSFWMKTNYVSGNSNTGAFVTFSQRTAAGASTAETSSSAGNIKITTDWTNYTGTFTTDNDAAYLLMKLGVTGNTGTATLIMDAWYDNIVVYPASIARVAASNRVTP